MRGEIGLHQTPRRGHTAHLRPRGGKTLALRKFRDGLNDNLFHPVYTPLSTLRGADLLRHINDRLGLANCASKAALYDQIQEYILDSREQRGRTLVLIIDEAHLLKRYQLDPRGRRGVSSEVFPRYFQVFPGWRSVSGLARYFRRGVSARCFLGVSGARCFRRFFLGEADEWSDIDLFVISPVFDLPDAREKVDLSTSPRARCLNFS